MKMGSRIVSSKRLAVGKKIMQVNAVAEMEGGMALRIAMNATAKMIGLSMVVLTKVVDLYQMILGAILTGDECLNMI